MGEQIGVKGTVLLITTKVTVLLGSGNKVCCPLTDVSVGEEVWVFEKDNTYALEKIEDEMTFEALPKSSSAPKVRYSSLHYADTEEEWSSLRSLSGTVE
jgi:hypothetical protein